VDRPVLAKALKFDDSRLITMAQTVGLQEIGNAAGR
jgi:hypothetical protein